MSCEGTCKKWFADRGFGFITQHGVQSELGDIFVHFTGISQRGRKSLNIGEKVIIFLSTSYGCGKTDTKKALKFLSFFLSVDAKVSEKNKFGN